MTKSQQISLGYVGIVVSMVEIALTQQVSGGPQTIVLASLAMLNVVNITHASDRTFLHRHRLLVAMILAGIVLPILYGTGARILTSTDWPFSEATRFPAMILSIIVVGGSAVLGFLRSTGNPTEPHAVSSER
ncbi:MAG: hypothetical protein ABL921_31645 [Pirellula sp.]